MSDNVDTLVISICELISDASDTLRANKNHVIGKQFHGQKRALIRTMYKLYECVECVKYEQHNPNVNDTEPYFLLKLTYKVRGERFTYYVPLEKVDWTYELTDTKIYHMGKMEAKPSYISVNQIPELITKMNLLNNLLTSKMQIKHTTERLNTYLNELSIKK